MNLKLRFALLFTLCVAGILISSSVAIYLLNSTYREADYYERVKTEGLEFYNALSDLRDPHTVSADELVKILHNSTLYNETIVLADTNHAILYELPDTMHVNISPAIFQKIKNEKDYRWLSANKAQNVGLYFPEDGRIIIATGFDRTGLAKMIKLRIILGLVLIAGLLLAAFISFLFVREAFRPLTKLSMELNNTSLQDLTRRLEVKKTKDEISEISESFNSMLERLDKAYRFQKSFVYHASHELRTPLATMLSETEAALGRKMSEDEYQQLLLSLKEEQQDIIELTNSLLLISQYEEMGFAQEWPELRVDELIYDTLSQAARAFPGLGSEVAFVPLPENDDDLIVKGNESLLKSAFFNLVKNAFLYSVDQHVMTRIEPDGDYIHVHIENGGPQPTPEEVEKLMVPFYRGNNALKSKGFGLGLSIIHRIVTIHKGRIAYQALSGNINRFTITLSKANNAISKEHNERNH